MEAITEKFLPNFRIPCNRYLGQSRQEIGIIARKVNERLRQEMETIGKIMNVYNTCTARSSSSFVHLALIRLAGSGKTLHK